MGEVDADAEEWRWCEGGMVRLLLPFGLLLKKGLLLFCDDALS